MPEPKNALAPEIRQSLVDAARSSQHNAYAPYSRYRVGAALLTASGEIFTGCNVENAATPAGICAERTAVAKAVSEGHRQFVAIAVITDDGGSPCGTCRQVLNEFSPQLVGIVATSDGEAVYEAPLTELLPRSFGPANLRRADSSPYGHE
ncbi:MAG: cytidine deaminase [Chloroflexi bacterium]|nr:cytidine deaminase [Chloroflexota bacterium]